LKLTILGLEPVSTAEGQSMGQAIGAYKYIECSALTQDNLQDVFHETIRSVINPGSSGSTPTTGGGKSTPDTTKKPSSKTEKKNDKKGKRDKSTDKKKGGIFSTSKK
jgi:hypothetical protein